MTSLFQLLMTTPANVRMASSFSSKCFETRSKSSSGMCVSEIRVSASVHSIAARSRSLKKGVSRQAFSA